jgi:hypothetical protein
VYLVPPLHSGSPTGPGKNYMLALGYAATFTESKTPTGETPRSLLDAGSNPPNGASVNFWLRQAPAGPVWLRFRDAEGRLVREVSSEPDPTPGAPPEPCVPKAAGLNRYVWNLRHAPARGVPGDCFTERSLAGPVVPPGRYSVELEVGDTTLTAPLEVGRDPKVRASAAELAAACAFQLRVRDKLSETHDAVNQMREVRGQIETWIRWASGHDSAAEVAAVGRRAVARIDELETLLIEPRAKVDGDRLHYPARLNAKLAAVPAVVSSADAAPTRQVALVFEQLAGQADAAIARWRSAQAVEVEAFRALVRRLDLPPVARQS